ncbi:MAG: imidazole glycerol phosphate synthase subunit HisH [Verrucomicrobia bacterium]|nr:imidazole glycerol phosphate synthase subunit HisH [Verrucomicrobiota bacterium]
MKIAMIDYGRGNLRSVERALEKAGATVARVEGPEGLMHAETVVLPGVGAFGDAVDGLKQRKLWEPLQDWVKADRPFLGICLGFQLLWEEGEEAKGVKGLGVLPGRVAKFSGKGLKIPLIGWSEVRPKDRAAEIFGVDDRYFYHVHSYRPESAPSEWLACETEYGGWFPSGVWKGRVAGFQFHPEKSQDTGISLLQRILGKIGAS